MYSPIFTWLKVLTTTTSLSGAEDCIILHLAAAALLGVTELLFYKLSTLRSRPVPSFPYIMKTHWTLPAVVHSRFPPVLCSCNFCWHLDTIQSIVNKLSITEDLCFCLYAFIISPGNPDKLGNIIHLLGNSGKLSFMLARETSFSAREFRGHLGGIVSLGVGKKNK